MATSISRLNLGVVTDNPLHIDPELATTLVRRYVDPAATVVSVRDLHGGMINRVLEFTLDDAAGSIVAKLNTAAKADTFDREMQIMQWYRQHTELPVPEPIACINGDLDFAGSGLLMHKVDGANLADAALSPRGRRLVQRDLAHHVAQLHSHHRQTFGSAIAGQDEGHARWLDAFKPTIEREFEAVRHLLSSRNRWAVEEMIHHLDHWLPEQATPTLVHGDLWATNVLVDDRHPDRPQILAFIDCGASYCDPEYELAYLRIFRTATDDFFDHYTKCHPLRPGFDRRCRVYWLNTIMLHVRLFGDQYLPRCEDLAHQIRQLS